MPTLYALLIGIDRYQPPIRLLEGCVNDVTNLNHFLKRHCQRDIYAYRPLLLENEAATRARIIESFTHFDLAQNGDACLLHFSGHGSQIPGPQFWESPNGVNQCILCADSQTDHADFDLIDKEISWLIHKAIGGKDIHFTTIMDCCHSGTNTRYGEMEQMARQWQDRRQERSITQYLGNQEYLLREDGMYSAPKAAHIALAACRPWQLAKEKPINGLIRGAFTASLIDALETSGGLLSYLNLESRVIQKINNRIFDQTPLFEAISGANINHTFLHGAIASKRAFTIIWNNSFKAWELDAGKVNGVNQANTTVKISGNQELVFKLEALLPFVSYWEPTQTIDLGQQYEVLVSGLGQNISTIVLDEGISQNIQLHLADSFAQAKTNYIDLVQLKKEGEYCVRYESDQIILTYTVDNKPFFYPASFLGGEQELIRFWYNCDAVLKWKNLLRLDNPQTGIQEDEFKIELWRSEGGRWYDFNTYEQVLNWQNGSTFEWIPDGTKAIMPGYTICVKNTSKRNLYATGFHLSGRFGITNEYLQNEKIGPGQEVWFSRTNQNGETRRSIGLDIEEYHWMANIKEMLDYAKILISTDPIPSTHHFNQDGLDLVKMPRTRSSLRDPFNDEEPDLPKPLRFDWRAVLIPLRIMKNI